MISRWYIMLFWKSSLQHIQLVQQIHYIIVDDRTAASTQHNDMVLVTLHRLYTTYLPLNHSPETKQSFVLGTKTGLQTTFAEYFTPERVEFIEKYFVVKLKLPVNSVHLPSQTRNRKNSLPVKVSGAQLQNAVFSVTLHSDLPPNIRTELAQLDVLRYSFVLVNNKLFELPFSDVICQDTVGDDKTEIMFSYFNSCYASQFRFITQPDAVHLHYGKTSKFGR